MFRRGGYGGSGVRRSALRRGDPWILRGRLDTVSARVDCCLPGRLLARSRLP